MVREYNEKNQANIYKSKLRSENDYKKKLELANKALEIKSDDANEINIILV